MKHTPSLSLSISLSISFLAIVACGGGKKPPPAAPKEPEPEPAAPVAETKPEPEPEPAPEPPPPPPPPAALHAQAELAPVKGVKIKAVTVTFTQQGTDPVAIGSTGWFDGIKAGKYHLVVHGGDACGANAAKAGKPMGGDIAFTATKSTDSLTVAPVALSLEGEGAIVGHPLVLHADKKGKPGKALACGMIAAGA